MSVAVIELREELYKITIVAWDRNPVVKAYYRQSSFGNIFRGRRFDLIVTKNVELTEEARREIAPCLVPNGKFVEVPA